MLTPVSRALLAFLAALLLAAPTALAQKSGGTLRAVLRDTPPSLSIHESATNEPVWSMSPVYNNLVYYDPLKKRESMDGLVGELAERWNWSGDGKALTFALRKGVKWHDGKPFGAADVKKTFDVLRGAASSGMRLNPRQSWYANVADIQVSGDHEVRFLLKAPQPSLLALLASGMSPVYPAHVDFAELRAKPIGTGPFRFVRLAADQEIVLEKNRDYFVKGRPYLDRIVYAIIKSRPTRTAGLISGQLDISFPHETTVATRDSLLKSVPRMVIQENATTATDNLLINTKRPSFDNVKARLALTLALDRAGLIKGVNDGGALLGAAMLSPPHGVWGLDPAELSKLPGYGNAVANKERARKLLAELGYGPSNPLKVTVSTRAIELYTTTAVWVVDELRKVGVDAKLEEVETTTWFPRLARREYQIGVNVTAVGADDPDANFFENYACGSQRNYSQYCDEEIQKLIEAQSHELNPARRLAMVHEIDRRLQQDGARPILTQRYDYFAHWPYVKNLVVHQGIYNWARMQEVWLDK